MSDATKYRISELEVIDHGLDHAQYFEGCGTSYTSFEYCVTGAGDNPMEAIEDAIAQLYSGAEDILDISDDELYELDSDIELLQKSETPSAADEVASQAPDARYRVYFTGYCGMVLEDESNLDEDEARELIGEIINSRQRQGYDVAPIGDDEDISDYSQEVEGRDDDVMVPDTCGILRCVQTNADEIESFGEDSELYYYVSIRYNLVLADQEEEEEEDAERFDGMS